MGLAAAGLIAIDHSGGQQIGGQFHTIGRECNAGESAAGQGREGAKTGGWLSSAWSMAAGVSSTGDCCCWGCMARNMGDMGDSQVSCC